MKGLGRVHCSGGHRWLLGASAIETYLTLKLTSGLIAEGYPELTLSEANYIRVKEGVSIGFFNRDIGEVREVREVSGAGRSTFQFVKLPYEMT